ncbi:MAG: NAD-dependent epimerase/dehydratase family protein [Candidatus Peribacteraceae bacterium]|nr:NAD-dependent epimerase/dehydratase family protein [Candidatus Peribacteraceae bacterium]MDD5740077.1 NAD-dependent epimerase/dehydratase family protein [Candidatus Peribacteraceae bacterium]
MKILVTGSSGTIGTRLCERLLEQQFEVVGADWEPNKWQPAIEKLTVRIDLRDENQLNAQSSKLKADVVIHLAANARVYELVENPDRARDNMLTTFNALAWARKNGVKRFVFASSRETYGNSGMDKYREDMVRVENCESPYTASKIAGEALVESYRRCYGMETVIVRFSNVYGMYDDSQRVVPLFIRQTKKNEPLVVFGKDKSLDFTYIDDAVNGLLLILKNFSKVNGQTINLAFGEAHSIMELAELIKKLMKSTSAISTASSRTGEVTRYTADISKARKILGFDPKVPFAEGVKKSVEWYGKQK